MLVFVDIVINATQFAVGVWQFNDKKVFSMMIDLVHHVLSFANQFQIIFTDCLEIGMQN